jgi:hypothetical protein
VNRGLRPPDTARTLDTPGLVRRESVPVWAILRRICLRWWRGPRPRAGGSVVVVAAVPDVRLDGVAVLVAVEDDEVAAEGAHEDVLRQHLGG